MATKFSPDDFMHAPERDALFDLRKPELEVLATHLGLSFKKTMRKILIQR